MGWGLGLGGQLVRALLNVKRAANGSTGRKGSERFPACHRKGVILGDPGWKVSLPRKEKKKVQKGINRAVTLALGTLRDSEMKEGVPSSLNSQSHHYCRHHHPNGRLGSGRRGDITPPPTLQVQTLERGGQHRTVLDHVAIPAEHFKVGCSSAKNLELSGCWIVTS